VAEAARRAALPVACAGLASLMLAPILPPGYVLVYDMVFTPRQPLLPDSIGLGSALPRAVPADAVVALATEVLPGQVVQKVVLLVAVWAAAYGAARLVPTGSLLVRLVAGAAYGWNAYVAERLFIGHWGVLVAYAALPFAVTAGLRLRRGEPGAWAPIALAMASAALAPTGGLLVAGAAAAAAGRRRLLPVAGLAAVLNAPWWVPGALHGGGAVSDPAAVASFAARAEGPGGVAASLLGLGGIWNADVVPASRQGVLVPLVAVLLVVGTVAGVRQLATAWGRAPVTALSALAAFGLLLAGAAAIPGVNVALRWLVGEVPGAGMLRDSQKWVAWWALLAAPACAMAAGRLAEAVRDRTGAAGTGGRGLAPVALLAFTAALPIAVLPDLAWGGAGRLRPVQYPMDWHGVRELLVADPRPGDVLVLPFQPYRRFAWNDERPQLDPAPRFLPRRTLVDDALTVDGRRLSGEDPRADRARRALADRDAPAGRDALADLGIGWVLVSLGTPGRVDQALLAGLPTAYSGRWLTLYRLPGPVAEARSDGPPAAPVLAADAAALGLLTVLLLHRWLPPSRFAAIAGRRRRE
jgi:hypothetical protein